MKLKHVSVLHVSPSTFSYSVPQHPGVKQWRWAPWGITSDFPGGAHGKEPVCQCRRLKRRSFNPGSGRSPGEGNGNPLQYSCLENPVDSGAWQAVIHRVAQSQTLLKWLGMPHPGSSWRIQNSGLWALPALCWLGDVSHGVLWSQTSETTSSMSAKWNLLQRFWKLTEWTGGWGYLLKADRNQNAQLCGTRR